MQPLTVGLVIPDRDVLAEVEACLRTLPVRVLLQQPDPGEWGAFADKLDRLRPDVLLVELSGLRDQLEVAIARMRRTAGAPVVVAIYRATDHETILRTIRAGAAEYLFPPLQAGLAAALERIAADRSAQRGQIFRAKAIAFLSVKGGCGATTLASHAGLELQRLTGGEVLLADLDLDAGMLGFLFKSKSQYT